LGLIKGNGSNFIEFTPFTVRVPANLITLTFNVSAIGGFCSLRKLFADGSYTVPTGKVFNLLGWMSEAISNSELQLFYCGTDGGFDDGSHLALGDFSNPIMLQGGTNNNRLNKYLIGTDSKNFENRPTSLIGASIPEGQVLTVFSNTAAVQGYLWGYETDAPA